MKEAAEKSREIVESGSDRAQSHRVKQLEKLDAQIRVCTKCPLCESRTLAVPGEGKSTARVMIIGEAPGKQEDESGRPFVGNAGRFLEHVLEGTGLSREDFFITNIVKCRPKSNRTPHSNEIETCTSLYLFKQMALINPELIVLLGVTAVKKLLGMKTIEEARGRIIKHDGGKYLATYHPAVRFYREDLSKKIHEDFDLLKKEMKKLK
ncbi:MAG TPA: uracil-DNA glycosylase [Verrucomicrobiae bacterium]|nr:uracil-DNA glycosylase [Verrucomicrobiae bacterium]